MLEMGDMEDFFERIETNEVRIKRSLINKGRKAGIQQNEDEEKIMKYTNAKKEDIENAKKELRMC